jgi:hypothetical protein
MAQRNGTASRGKASKQDAQDVGTSSDGTSSAASGRNSGAWERGSHTDKRRHNGGEGLERLLPTSGMIRKQSSKGADVYEIVSSSDGGSVGSEAESSASEGESEGGMSASSDDCSVRSGGGHRYAQRSQSPTQHKPALPHLPEMQPGRGGTKRAKTPGKGSKGSKAPRTGISPPPPLLPQQQPTKTPTRGQDVLAQAQAAPARKRTRLTAEQRAFIAGREQMAAELYAK